MPGWLSGLGELILAQYTVHSLCTGLLHSPPRCPLPSPQVFTFQRSGQDLHFTSRCKHHPLEWPVRRSASPKVSPLQTEIVSFHSCFLPSAHWFHCFGARAEGRQRKRGASWQPGSKERNRGPRSPLSLEEHVPSDLTSFPCSPTRVPHLPTVLPTSHQADDTSPLGRNVSTKL